MHWPAASASPSCACSSPQPFSRRTGVHPCAAGRRDQPRAPAHAECAAGGHGRTAGHPGRTDPSPARSLLRDRHAEPGGPVRHVPAARFAAGSIPAAPGDGLPQRPGGARAAAWNRSS
ncbi:hypothetical protein G6F50_016006 [Rhizopus delemar]|uniref:Uncharacterized protein n=1 Tax=Rhizopus delemar TaxID=936053 RepID=A0A9P6XVF9_9FUNG|nr:hypothetical protein G6F50_016006 [Rhizopus delemar]